MKNKPSLTRVRLANWTLCFLLLALVLQPVLADNKESDLITFRGVSLGEPGAIDEITRLCRERVTGAQGEDRCATRESRLGRLMVFPIEFGNLDPEDTYFYFDTDGSLKSLSSNPKSPAKVTKLISLLKEKYPNAEITSKLLSSAAGVQYERIIFEYSDIAGNRLRVRSIAGRIDEGSLVFESAEAIREIKKMMREREEAARSKL